MTDGRRDDELRELLALAAVGALDGMERAELDAAIAERPDLQAELAELEDAAALMADDVSAPPPPTLRAGVLAAIEDVPQLPPDEPAPDAPSAGDVVSLDAARHRRRWWMPAVAAAAAVAILAGVIVAVANGDDDGDVDVATVVDDADATVIPLEGELSGLRLVHSAANDATAIVGDDVPAPDEDRVYELWRIQGDQAPEKVEIFRPADGGVVEVLLPGVAPSEGVIYAVTIEPPGGSDQPTGDIIASSTT